VDRNQASFLPSRIDDYVAADAAVRVIDAFVEGLDMFGLGLVRATPAATGRPGYDPRDLLKLYIYGYLNEVRSSRKLERECRRNVELMWLLGRLAPDFKTIADFRRDNAGGIVGTCRAFVLFCREQGLFAARLWPSTVRSSGRWRAPSGLWANARSPKRPSGSINRSRLILPTSTASMRASRLTAMRNRRLRPSRLSGHAAPTLMLWQRDLKAEDRTSLVEGELDARPMGKGAGSKPPSYNVQTAVDAATGLIVHHEVTTEPTDNRLLHPMAKATKDAVAANTLTVVADAGYSNGADAAACENDGITPCVPANRAVNNQGDFFDRTAFIYEPQTDSFRCPAGWCASKSSLESRASCIWPTIVRVARSSRDAPASSAASFKDTFTRTRFNA
jgi:transposase